MLLCLALYPGGSFEALPAQATVDCHHRSSACSEQTSKREEQHRCSPRDDSNRSSTRGVHDGRKYFCHTVSCRQLKHKLILAMESRLCLDSVLMDVKHSIDVCCGCQPSSRSTRHYRLHSMHANISPAAWSCCCAQSATGAQSAFTYCLSCTAVFSATGRHAWLQPNIDSSWTAVGSFQQQ